ncbi:VWA domain-containing protein [Candidatus Poribacteria bacterium]|nr:VWA domain-containing protein [Candidatus Poribacteria bacterium]
MNRFERKQRSLNACLIAGIVHLCLAIFLTFFYYTRVANDFEDVVGVEFVDMNDPTKQKRRLKRPPPKQMLTPKQTKSLTAGRPKHVALTASSNLIDETVRPSEKILMHNATETISETAKQLPDVTTDTREINSRTASIAKSVTSPFEITSGAGKESLRQRVKGDGESGFHRLETTGAAEIGPIGEGIGLGGDGGSGKGMGTMDASNPFAKALKQIADHIIATRTLDKVNVVFVLDTSASMGDNIQQVAENLFSMTDAFDLVNLEYHLGMSEFSVREGGQELETRSLAPDVGYLRRRMQKVKLSGDENALDALIDTLNFMDFHADADKHLILVTDEPATTSMREEGASETVQAKVIDQSQIEDIHVNVLGFPEPFQQELATTTGGVWQQIPGSVYNPAALPTNRAGNQKFLKVFRDIATDIRKGGAKKYFSLDLKFDMPVEDGEIPLDKLQQTFKENRVGLKNYTFRSENATVLDKNHNGLWVITDRKNKQIYGIYRIENRLDVYAGIYPKNWNLGENLTAQTQQHGKRWVLTHSRNNQIYTFLKDKNRLNVYTGGQPGTASNNAAEPIVDIMVMLDYSRSMGGKSQAIMLGLSTLIGRLSILPIKYRIGLIRFAEAKDAIKAVDGAVVSQMPLNEVLIDSLMEDPFGGDEHLIDAIVDGVPQVKFSPYASRFLLILTDEPTTGKYPAEQALELCQSLGITAYVIGHPNPNDFQTTLATQTGGIFFTMPKFLEKAYPNQ